MLAPQRIHTALRRLPVLAGMGATSRAYQARQGLHRVSPVNEQWIMRSQIVATVPSAHSSTRCLKVARVARSRVPTIGSTDALRGSPHNV